MKHGTKNFWNPTKLIKPLKAMRLLAGNAATADMFTWLMKLRKFVRYAPIQELILSAKSRIIDLLLIQKRQCSLMTDTALPVFRLSQSLGRLSQTVINSYRICNIRCSSIIAPAVTRIYSTPSISAKLARQLPAAFVKPVFPPRIFPPVTEGSERFLNMVL